jgi:RND family efflux transporter MFP subunit
MTAKRSGVHLLLLSQGLLGLAAALLVAPAAAPAGDAAAGTRADAATLMPVSVLHTAAAEGYRLERVYSGRVEPFRNSDTGFERAGLLAEVAVREGDRVSAGQLLARLDTALLQARRRELAAGLAQAEADLALAEATLTRHRGSVQQGAVTRQALDEAQAAERAAVAALDLARARVGSVDLDIARSTLYAPFAGAVTRRLADEGRVLQAGEPVLRLQETRTPELRVGVAGALAERLEPGRVYPLSHRDRSFDARLRAVLPVRAGAARTVDALFAPVAPDTPEVQALRPGDLVQLRLADWIDEPGTWLPLASLTRGMRGLWNVYRVESGPGIAEAEGTGRLRLQPVEVLHQAGERVFVRAGLADGTRIVAAGLHRVVPGQQVRLLDDTGARMARHDTAAPKEAR